MSIFFVNYFWGRFLKDIICWTLGIMSAWNTNLTLRYTSGSQHPRHFPLCLTVLWLWGNLIGIFSIYTYIFIYVHIYLYIYLLVTSVTLKVDLDYALKNLLIYTVNCQLILRKCGLLKAISSHRLNRMPLDIDSAIKFLIALIIGILLCFQTLISIL